MSAVRQLHGRPTPRRMPDASPNSLIRCNTRCECSEPLSVEHERNDEDFHGSSKRFCLQNLLGSGQRRVSLKTY